MKNYHGGRCLSNDFLKKPEPLTAAQYFELLHGEHSHAVYVSGGKPWKDIEAPDRAEARAKLDSLQGCPDYYMSMNGQELFTSRKAVHCRAVTSFYLDFDYYDYKKTANPELSGLSFWEVARRIYDAAPWLPVATVTTDSGRGLYLIWILDRPVTDADEIKQWKEIETLLVDALCFKTLGSDPAVKDAARVLRFPGSINSKSNSTVAAYQTGERVSMESMREAALHCGAGKLAKSMFVPADKKSQVKPFVEISSIRTEYWLKFYSHIRRVIEQQIAPYLARNSIERKVPEWCRESLLFNHSVCLSWTEPDRMKREKLAREFVQDWLSEPGLFIGLESVKTALHGSNGQLKTLSPKTIGALFNLPAPIRLSLMTIVYRKNKGMGKETQEARTARIEARRTEERRMRAEGYSLGKISAALDIPMRTLRNDLNQPCDVSCQSALLGDERSEVSISLHDYDHSDSVGVPDFNSDCDSEKSGGASMMTPTPGALLSAFMVLKNILIPSPDALPWEAAPRSTGCPSMLLSSPSEARKLLLYQCSPPLDDGFRYSVSGYLTATG